MLKIANVALILATATLVASNAFAHGVGGGHAVAPRAVFASRDPQGRLPNTTIRPLGTLRVRKSLYEVYYLDFINPVSLHGQQRIAIIKNGNMFMGSYQCTLGRGPDDGSLVIGSDHVTVRREGVTFTIHFNQQGPTRNKYFCGEGSGWEDSV